MASDFEKPDKVHTLFPEEIPVKCGLFQWESFFFLANPLKKTAGCRDQNHRRSGSWKKAKIQALLGEKQDSSYISMPVALMTPLWKQNLMKQKDSVWKLHLTMIWSHWSRHFRSCWNNAIFWPPACAAKEKCTCISVTFRTLDFETNLIRLNCQMPPISQKRFTEMPKPLSGVLDETATPAPGSITDRSYGWFLWTAVLFEDTHKKERQQKLDAALDSIRLKYGNDKVTRASIMNSTARIGRKAKAQMENERE